MFHLDQMKSTSFNHQSISLLLPSVFLVEDRIKGNFSLEISWLHPVMQNLQGCEPDLPGNMMLLFPQKNAGCLDASTPVSIVALPKKKPIPHLGGRTVHCHAGLLESQKSDH